MPRENVPGHPPDGDNPGVTAHPARVNAAADMACVYCGEGPPEVPVLVRVASLYEIGRDVEGFDYEDAVAVDGWACLSCLGVRD